jgi:inosine-uridine nucleoside N-ribohydrolase
LARLQVIKTTSAALHVGIKVLLDTDIGSDIDDAVALAYLLAQPECELLGVTTVTGESRKRAMMASALCKAAGRRVSIHPGSEKPLHIPQRQTEAPQAEALPRWGHDDEFPGEGAVEFLRRTIRRHPGEVTLLAIGPLTNIGLLFDLDPDVPRLLKGLVMMCGMFGDDGTKAEWNARGDPHATSIVYGNKVGIHRSVGLDVTERVRMNSGEVREKFRSELLRPVLDFADVWFRHNDGIAFHDPLAAASVFDEEICTYEAGTVRVETGDGEGQGRTRWSPGGDSTPHEVAVGVDPSAFFDHLLAVFD